MSTSERPVPESTRAAVARAQHERRSAELRDEVAATIADWYGRAPIDADRDLAGLIIDRIRLHLIG